jgi:toxin ParE1/3/4
VLDVRWALMAQADMARILRHYQMIDTAVAAEVGRRILDATRVIAGLPYGGAVTARGDRRKWHVPGTRYQLFYRPAKDHIRVLRVLHGAQDQVSRQ